VKDSSFWVYLFGIALITTIGIYFIHKIEPIVSYSLLSYMALGFMLAGTIILFFLGKKSLISQNKYSFIHLVIGSVFLKIVIAIAIIAVYSKLVHPTTKYFVVPFLCIYLIFSVFETIVLYKLALAKQTKY